MSWGNASWAKTFIPFEADQVDTNYAIFATIMSGGYVINVHPAEKRTDGFIAMVYIIAPPDTKTINVTIEWLVLRY